MKKPIISPDLFALEGPQTVDEFIGETQDHARIFTRKAKELNNGTKGRLVVLFHGVPGTGKSKLALMIARELVGPVPAARHNIEKLNGQSMSVDRIRQWEESMHYYPLYGKRIVKVVDELDKAGEAAQAELLTCLDQGPMWWDFIATTNVPLGAILKRVTSRMQQVKVEPVPTEAVKQFLMRWIPAEPAEELARANLGDVRGALNDAATFLDQTKYITTDKNN